MLRALFFVFSGCRVKFHKDHVIGVEHKLAPCKLSYDPTSAKEMLLMAATIEEQQLWVSRLHKRIQKSGFKATGGAAAAGDVSILSAVGGTRISPQESMRSQYKPPIASAAAQKSSTLPANTGKK